MTKACTLCGRGKALGEFRKNHRQSSGRTPRCKSCLKKLERTWRNNNREKISAYEKVRSGRPARKRLSNVYRLRNAKRYPEKQAARAMVHYHLKTGKLTPKPCRICGAKAEAHHGDYSKPLEVDWLCHKHHMMVESGLLT